MKRYNKIVLVFSLCIMLFGVRVFYKNNIEQSNISFNQNEKQTTDISKDDFGTDNSSNIHIKSLATTNRNDSMADSDILDEKGRGVFSHNELSSNTASLDLEQLLIINMQSYSNIPELHANENDWVMKDMQSYSDNPELFSNENDSVMKDMQSYSDNPELFSNENDSVMKDMQSYSANPELFSNENDLVMEDMQNYSNNSEWLSNDNDWVIAEMENSNVSLP